MSNSWRGSRSSLSSFVFVRPKGSIKKDLMRASLDGTKRSIINSEHSTSTLCRTRTLNEEPKLKSTNVHYQSQRSKETFKNHHHHGRRLSFQEIDRPTMVTQDLKVDEELVTGDEPPPPPQPPYHLPLQQMEESRGMRMGRERRSTRKLTKDSGYETSQYSESDYANVDWEQGSDWSPTSKSNRSPSSDWGNASDHEFAASPPPAYHDRSLARTHEGWRDVYSRSNGKCNYQNWDPNWAEEEVTSTRAVPVHYTNHRTSSVSLNRRCQPLESPGRRFSTDSSASGFSSCNGFPQTDSARVLSAKSTPSLRHDDESPRKSALSLVSSSSNMSNSTPNLDKMEKPKVIRRPKESSYDPQLFVNRQTSFRKPRNQWEESYEGTQNMGPYQHTRQVSSQSSGSDRTSSSYSQHSRQVSSQSSFSEEDFCVQRIQRIKEEFHQCTTYPKDYFPQPSPPYPMRCYSSEGLIYSQKVSTHWEQQLNPPVDNDVDSGKGSASPPPPPVRNSSSLKYNSQHCAVGHEKFSSWPVDGTETSNSYYRNKKECPPSYYDGPPPPYTPHWTRSETREENETEKSGTPLMDRLRKDAQQNTWTVADEISGRNYNGRESVTSSTSSQETLKWQGSMSDLSVQSDRIQSPSTAAVVPVTVHSARVKPPQRHHSESVLYYGNGDSETHVKVPINDRSQSKWAEQVHKNNVTNSSVATKNKLQLPHANSITLPRSQTVANEEIRTLLTPDYAKPLTSVAQRIHDLERMYTRANKNENFNKTQQQVPVRKDEDERGNRALYLDPAKKHRVDGSELKAIQKNAVRSFFEQKMGGHQRRYSSSSRSSQSLPRNCYSEAPSSSQRVVDVKVAIYYNTYTQTLVTGDEPQLVREKRNSGSFSATPTSLAILKEVEDKNRPRRDIALQTDWTASIGASPSKDQKSIAKDAQIKSRENSTSHRPDTKKLIPPERPPKRPQLKRSTSNEETVPAPRYVGVSTRSALDISIDEDVEDQELLRIEESAHHLRNLDPPPTRPSPPTLNGQVETDELIRESTPDLPLPPPPANTDENVIVNDEPLPPPPTPNEVKKIIKSSKLEAIEESVSSSLTSPNDFYMTYRSDQQQGELDANYHQTSPEIIKFDMESNQLPNLSPTAWEKMHNIGLRGPTVVYKSTDLKQRVPFQPITIENKTGIYNDHQGKLVSTQREDESLRGPSLKDAVKKTKEKDNDRLQINGISPLSPSIAMPTSSLTNLSIDGLKSPSSSLQSKEDVRQQAESTLVNKYGQVWRQQEVECEILSKDLVRQLPGDEKALQVLLAPCQLKTTADYMQGLFEVSTASRRAASRAKFNHESLPQITKDNSKRLSSKAVLPADSAYYTTSESKARFLTRYGKDVMEAQNADNNAMDVGKIKEDLETSIGRKLEILREEQLIIQEEISANQELGRTVTNRVEKLAKSSEIDKFKQHVDKIDKITNLLLGLSGRLARAENALVNLSDDSSSEERKVINDKRDMLFKQREEAKVLKKHIDDRSLQVSDFLRNYFSSDEYADYDHFIKMKSELLIASREIDDKIKLGEEQLMALKNNLSNCSL